MSSIEILVPELPESVADATVATWNKQEGDSVQRDEIIVEIETDKVVLEVPATEAGILEKIVQPAGATVISRQLLGQLRPADLSGKPVPGVSPTPVGSPVGSSAPGLSNGNDNIGPAVRRLISEHGLNPADIKTADADGRITRQDVERHLAQQMPTAPEASVTTTTSVEAWVRQPHRTQKRVPMTRLRKRIAERLLDAKNNTAMLTTFNEVNMKPIMDLRKQYGESFEKRHDVKLGFMSFYVKAALEALKRYPEVNASIDGEDVIYHNYFDISIAVSTPRGLITPVLRDVDALGMADIEKGIKELALKGRDGKLSVEDLSGGNFTVTNGGVFGSLMSTPLINPPQSAILGMHAIKERPMAVNGQVVILPMMYLALSYDHRLVDGKEAVGFLVTIKDMLEDPTRLLLDV
jgi:2-oxoglutarate dehydrogenase E2 component (dihydrolipoamide succinyltransferase)